MLTVESGCLQTVCSEDRATFAAALRAFVTGKITNFEFEGREPDTADLAVHEIAHEAWLLYDDLSEHKLDGIRAPTPELRRSIARSLLFLRTERWRTPSTTW